MRLEQTAVRLGRWDHGGHKGGHSGLQGLDVLIAEVHPSELAIFLNTPAQSATATVKKRNDRVDRVRPHEIQFQLRALTLETHRNIQAAFTERRSGVVNESASICAFTVPFQVVVTQASFVSLWVIQILSKIAAELAARTMMARLRLFSIWTKFRRVVFLIRVPSQLIRPMGKETAFLKGANFAAPISVASDRAEFLEIKHSRRLKVGHSDGAWWKSKHCRWLCGTELTERIQGRC
mmetsp:Transcript_16018/g.37775  ORF Transcript_16018/g.37775 Transcript_16018/m.37775 type:complete len:236 (-) Transcript_16018:106-813(-)